MKLSIYEAMIYSGLPRGILLDLLVEWRRKPEDLSTELLDARLDNVLLRTSWEGKYPPTVEDRFRIYQAWRQAGHPPKPQARRVSTHHRPKKSSTPSDAGFIGSNEGENA